MARVAVKIVNKPLGGDRPSKPSVHIPATQWGKKKLISCRCILAGNISPNSGEKSANAEAKAQLLTVFMCRYGAIGAILSSLRGAEKSDYSFLCDKQGLIWFIKIDEPDMLIDKLFNNLNINFLCYGCRKSVQRHKLSMLWTEVANTQQKKKRWCG